MGRNTHCTPPNSMSYYKSKQGNTLMRLSPTLHKTAMTYNSPTIVEDNIDFWYDSLNDCYYNDMPIKMVLTYVEAITDEDSE